MGGMVLETNMSEIMLRIEEQNKIEKEEVSLKDEKADLPQNVLMGSENLFFCGLPLKDILK